MGENSNSKQMDVAELIVQKIKSGPLMELVGDEDAITALARRAIEEALFKDIRVPSGDRWRPDDVHPSPVMRAAMDAAKAAAEKLVKGFTETLLADKAFAALVSKALGEAVIRTLDPMAQTLIHNAMVQTQIDTLTTIRNHVQAQKPLEHVGLS